MEPTIFELLFTSGTLENGIFSIAGSIVIVSGLLLVLRENTKRTHAKIDKVDAKTEANERSFNDLRLEHTKLKSEVDTRNKK
jgi:hypothetical protein